MLITHGGIALRRIKNGNKIIQVHKIKYFLRKTNHMFFDEKEVLSC